MCAAGRGQQPRAGALEDLHASGSQWGEGTARYVWQDEEEQGRGSESAFRAWLQCHNTIRDVTDSKHRCSQHHSSHRLPGVKWASKKPPKMALHTRLTLPSLGAGMQHTIKWRARRRDSGWRPPPGGPQAATKLVLATGHQVEVLRS
jgi:hypothetical protein